MGRKIRKIANFLQDPLIPRGNISEFRGIAKVIPVNVTDLWDHKNCRLTNSKYPFPDPDLSSCHRQLKNLHFRKLLEIEIRSPWKLFEFICWSTDGILIKPWRGINWVPQVITIKFTIKLLTLTSALNVWPGNWLVSEWSLLTDRTDFDWTIDTQKIFVEQIKHESSIENLSILFTFFQVDFFKGMGGLFGHFGDTHYVRLPVYSWLMKL